MTIDEARNCAQIFAYAAGGIAALWGLWTYSRSVKLQRAKWLKELYEKFYERKDLKHVRDLLDEQDPYRVAKLVRDEEGEFTDYLNFFEFLGYLLEKGQLKKRDVLDLFEYYLRRIEENPAVVQYLCDPQKGYEKLRRLLTKVTINRFLFVYGTLMNGFDSLEDWQNKVRATFQGQGEISARLYDLGEFPGAVQSNSRSRTRVKGEVYLLKDPELAVNVLDEYEEFFPQRPEKSLFVRRLVPVTLQDGRAEEAWVYFYGREIGGRKPMPSGDYRKRVDT